MSIPAQVTAVSQLEDWLCKSSFNTVVVKLQQNHARVCMQVPPEMKLDHPSVMSREITISSNCILTLCWISLSQGVNHFLFFSSDEAVNFVNKPKTTPEISVSPSEDLELVCEVSAASGAVIWKKDHTEVKQDQRTTIISQGTHRKLIVKNVTLKDQGSYSCETKDDKATFQVKVRGEKMLGIPGIKECFILRVLNLKDQLTASLVQSILAVGLALLSSVVATLLCMCFYIQQWINPIDDRQGG